MTNRNGVRTGVRKRETTLLQIQTTTQRRSDFEELSTSQDTALLPGPPSPGRDLGHDEEADGDQLLDDGEDSECGEPAGEDLPPNDEADEEMQSARELALSGLLGSRPPVVLLRLRLENGELVVRSCARPAKHEGDQALELLRELVTRCFRAGRDHVTEEEWNQLLGTAPATLLRRLTLLLRLAIKGSEKVGFGKDEKAVSTPRDIGLERFANKFAALPDGTPFSLRLLLLDQRGRPSDSNDYFDQLPDAVKLLALRRALQSERRRKVAVSDLEFCGNIQDALEELLGAEIPMPSEDRVRRGLRDNFKRKGLGNPFPNQRDRQRTYDQPVSASLLPDEERS